jgi:uncharacterized protein YvpB
MQIKESKVKRILLILMIAFIGGALYAAYEQNEIKINKSEMEIENVSASEKKHQVLINNVPLIQQKPELDRGCEVTSLAMLLQYAGVSVDKMELAEKIKKDDTPYKKVDGAYYYGNPNDGFIGDIYTFKNMGYGVYHEPVAELAEKYLPGNIQDMTGSSFEEVIKKVGEGHPVWVIINADFKKLPESEFRTWNTPSGQVQITWKEHSVVITGFDENNIYINDPLNPEANRKKARADFKAAWEQMGSQAITIK